MNENNKKMALVRTKDVFERFGMSRSSFYSKIKKGIFPPPIQISERMTGFEEQEIEMIIKGMKKNLPEDERIKISQEIVERRNVMTQHKLHRLVG